MVTKKADKQRLIIDARPTNRFFRTPPSTLLGSVECWGRMEVSREGFFVAQEDVRNFFYRLGISKELGEYFALPEVDADLLAQEMGELPSEASVLASKGHRIYPHLRVLPMGFSWAFHLAHEAHVHLAKEALPGVPVAVDRRPAPTLTPQARAESAMMIYADNNNHVALSSKRVSSDQKIMMDKLHEHGLATHDITEASHIAESLGVRIDGLAGRITATPARDWRLWRALQALEARPFISGEELQVVLGHMTMRSMLNRSLLSILRHAYVFVAQCYKKRTRLWRSVALEMYLFRSLMILGEANVMAEWSTDMFCTDASLSGYAVMCRQCPQEIPMEVRSFDERWRFKRTEGTRVAPRRAALEGMDVFEDVETVLPNCMGEVRGPHAIQSSFPEVPQGLMEQSHWQCLWAAHMQFSEPIHQIEARSVLSLVKHLAKDRRFHNRRVAAFNDNMGVVLAVSKGRCASYGLLRLLRRISAHLLGTGIRLHLRWVPSEVNTADVDSRRWEASRSPVDAKKASKKARGDFQQERGGNLKQEVQTARRDARCLEQGKETEVANSESRARAQSGVPRWSQEDGGCAQEKEAAGHEAENEVREENESHARGEVDPGGEQREGATEERLLASASKVLCVCRPLRVRHHDGERSRRSAVRVQRCALPGRGRCQQWSEAVGGPRVRHAGMASRRCPELAKVQAGAERLAQAGAAPEPSSASRVPEGSYLRSDDVLETEGDGADERIHVLHIRQAGRDILDGRGCGAGKSRLRANRGAPQPSGARGVVKGRGLRRDFDPRRPAGPMAGEAVEGARHSAAAEVWEGRSSVDVHGERLPEDMAAVCGDPRHWFPGAESISEQARWSKPRPSAEAQKCYGHTETRSVVFRDQCPHLRQARTPAEGDQQVSRGLPGFRRRCEEKLRILLPQWLEKAAGESDGQSEAFKGSSFLSLFGGEAKGAEFVASQGGIAMVVDFAHSSQNDLSKPRAWNDLYKILPDFDFVGVDLPCETFSRARRAPADSPMPQALRGDSPKHIFGLSMKDAEKVRKSNNMVWGAIRLIKKSLKMNISGYLENPLTSRLWKVPALQRLLRDPRVHFIPVDMCRYNNPFRKPTGLLVWNTAPFQMLRCRPGFCVRTKRRHVQLTGVAYGKFLTRQAQAYSASFAASLLTCLKTHRHALNIAPTHPPK